MENLRTRGNDCILQGEVEPADIALRAPTPRTEVRGPDPVQAHVCHRCAHGGQRQHALDEAQQIGAVRSVVHDIAGLGAGPVKLRAPKEQNGSDATGVEVLTLDSEKERMIATHPNNSRKSIGCVARKDSRVSEVSWEVDDGRRPRVVARHRPQLDGVGTPGLLVRRPRGIACPPLL